MPVREEKISVRITKEAKTKIDRLRKIWGPVISLSVADVVEESIDRSFKEESKQDRRTSCNRPL